MGLLILRSSAVAAGEAQTGLDFPENGASGGDIRLVWDGANFLSRTAHTMLWAKLYHPGQVGYHADTWHSPNTGSWDGGAYSFGVHGHPCDGTYDPDGQRSNPGFGSGTEQWFEIAGVDPEAAGLDHIAIPMEPAFVLNEPGNGSAPAQAGQWLVHARQCTLINGDTQLRHRAWPDILTAPNDYIEMILDVGDLGAAGASPAFYIGASDWTATGSTNSETPYGVIRGIRLFDSGALSIADLQAEAAAIGDDTAASATGIANTWYINDNPTPDDITDKSGEGHDPSWDNANRPTLWES